MAGLWCHVWLVVLVATAASASSCPPVCSCRWKNGKRSVECRDEGLASLPSGVDADTQVLDLSGNNLQVLRKHAFKRNGLINLQKIFLRNCKIGEVNPSAFTQLTNLVELDLSENLLTEVPALSFSHTHALRDLHLGGNRLHRIRSDSFAHTPSLVRLDLSFAGIRSVAPSAFEPLSLLEKIDVQGNQLSELPSSAVRSLERVHGLEVHDNPWMCDCRVLPLWRLLEERKVPHPVSPTCHTPQRIAGMAFHSLTTEDFACPPEIRPVMRVVEGVSGENTTVACPVGGQPPPDVMWYKGDQPVVNGSVVGSGPQRLYIVNDMRADLVSRLVITGAQETDSGSLRCVAINSAGVATANFTLDIKMRAATKARLDSGHIAGISVGLVVVALIALVVGFLVLARARTTASPTPVKDSSTAPSSAAASPCEPNPVQKPPRLTDVNGSSGTIGSSTLGNPDVISEAERAVRAVNGHIPNGSIQGVSEGGDYTRVEGDSLYPSGLWPEDATPQEATDTTEPPIHEHFNPGYMSSDAQFDGYGPVHSTPYRPGYESQDFDPQTYGYPADYGLPIPEAKYDPREAPQSNDWSMSDLRDPNEGIISRGDTYASRQELFPSQQDVYNSPQDLKGAGQEVYGVAGSRPPVYGYRPEVYGSRENVAEGAESPQSPTRPLGERPWVPGSQAPPHTRGGVPVLPPLPNGLASRIKARDSPDEGYQEGTEV